jgi:hypothetical protein
MAKARALTDGGAHHSRGFPAASVQEAAQAVEDLEFIEASVRKELLERAVHEAHSGNVPGKTLTRVELPVAAPEQLLEAMRRLGGQTYVRLERLNAGDNGTQRVADALASGGGDGDRLKALYLGENDIGDAGADSLASALTKRPPSRFARLYMQGNPRISRSAANRLKGVCDACGIALIGLETDAPPPPPKPPSRPTSRPRSPVPTPEPAPAAAAAAAAAASPPPPPLLLPCNRSRRPASASVPQRPASASVARLSRGRAAEASLAPEAAARAPAAEAGASAARVLRPQHEPRFRQTRPRPPAGRADPSIQSPIRYDLMPCSRTLGATPQLWKPASFGSAAELGGQRVWAPRATTWPQCLREEIHLGMNLGLNLGMGARKLPLAGERAPGAVSKKPGMLLGGQPHAREHLEVGSENRPRVM